MDTTDRKLVLPDDKVDVMTRKREEYKDRVRERDSSYDYEHPELFAIRHPKYAHRIAVLDELIEHREVSSWELSQTLSKKFGAGFDVEQFNKAFALVLDYVENDGVNLFGGTGLH